MNILEVKYTLYIGHGASVGLNTHFLYIMVHILGVKYTLYICHGAYFGGKIHTLHRSWDIFVR